ncbi:hypothetical protein [Nonomuraea sp. NPDC001023]|uniref:hypothetical protein n=1 Tax=unclassified Nonomuraea TaxID=2593643 RepID=UPI003327CA97
MNRNQDARRVLVQADLDAWHATAFLARRPATALLRWCVVAGHMPKVAIPTRVTVNPGPDQPVETTRPDPQALSDESVPDRDRVIALLVLLFAQPISRILRLSLDDPPATATKFS